MITIGYEATSLAVSPYGGIARYCYHVLQGAGDRADVRGTALYRYGSSANLSITGVSARKLSWLSRILGEPYDIAHSLCHRLPNVRSGKIVYTVHDAWSLAPNRWQGEAYQKRLGRRMRREIGRADLVVADSDWTRTQLLALGVVDESRCRTVPLGVVLPDERSAGTIGPEVQEAIRRRYVLFVGRIENRKNLEHVVEAVRPLPALELVLVGEPGFGYEGIAERTLSRFPSERLICLKRVSSEELSALYRNAVATLQPSWEEGFGLPVLEGMAHGSPVITSNGTSCVEVAGDGALLVDPSRPQESQAWLERLVEENGFREALIRRGSERARQFSWERSFAALLEGYRWVLGT
jgi:glycosyltransferase involved in cell wall biosynthesis